MNEERKAELDTQDGEDVLDLRIEELEERTMPMMSTHGGACACTSSCNCSSCSCVGWAA